MKSRGLGWVLWGKRSLPERWRRRGMPGGVCRVSVPAPSETFGICFWRRADIGTLAGRSTPGRLKQVLPERQISYQQGSYTFFMVKVPHPSSSLMLAVDRWETFLQTAGFKYGRWKTQTGRKVGRTPERKDRSAERNLNRRQDTWEGEKTQGRKNEEN